MPAPQHSVFTGRKRFLPPNQQHQSIEGSIKKQQNNINRSNINKTVNSTMQAPNIWEQ